MWHLISLNIKHRIRSKSTQLLFIMLFLVMLTDPITLYFHGISSPSFFDVIGSNGFQFWLLMNSASWGSVLYHTLFWFFTVLATGMVSYYEKATNFNSLIIIRSNRNKYWWSHIISTMVFTFLLFLVLLSMNLIVTILLFPLSNPLSAQYAFIIPTAGTFADYFYKLSPFCMMLFYTALNAFVLALFSCLVTIFHMAFSFHKNYFFSLIIPVIFMYTVSFLFDIAPSIHQYNISMLVQPAAAYGLTAILSGKVLVITLIVWCLLLLCAALIGRIKTKDIL